MKSLSFAAALCLSFVICQFAHAEKKWTFVFSEDRVWQAHTVTLDKAGWPRLTEQKYFPNQHQARVFAHRTKARVKPPLPDQELKSQNGQTLWDVKQEWNWSWEQKFATWINTELNPGWWKQNGIATDCADVVYSARWIFARNNGLPMANHLLTGQIFTHNSVKIEWENLPTDTDWRRDQKFQAALDYLLSQAFTHTLWQDSYPTSVNVNSILPGGYHLYIDQTTGHTQFIYQIGRRPEEPPLITLNSTVPRELRDLMEWLFFENDSDPTHRALMRMRWPQFANGTVTFKPAAAMPYYSTEQFQPGFIRSGNGTFWREVYDRLHPRADFDLIAQRTVQQIIDQLKIRVPVVENGFRECSLSPCVPGTLRYDAWSTPSRDDRIAKTVANFDSLSSMISSWSDIRRIMRTPVLRLDGLDYSGSDLISIWRSVRYSSDPNDSPRRRWGIDYY